MKKLVTILLSAALLFAAVTNAGAQSQPQYLQPVFKTLSPRNLSNTDTLDLNFNSIGSAVKSFQITVLKVSGTVAGTVYLWASSDAVAYFKLDSLALTNVATAQTLKYIPTSTAYKNYRASFLTSGTQSYTPYFSYVRRPDE